MDNVKVKCRRCDGEYFSNELSLDPVYGLVVCKDCIRGRKVQEEVKQKRVEEKAQNEVPEAPSKPAGWDEDDLLLEKLAKEKERNQTIKFINPGKVKCQKCSYRFNYDEFLNRPANCPYCSMVIKK